MTTFLVASGLAFWALVGISFAVVSCAVVRGVRQLHAERHPTAAQRCITDIENYLRTEAGR